MCSRCFRVLVRGLQVSIAMRSATRRLSARRFRPFIRCTTQDAPGPSRRRAWSAVVQRHRHHRHHRPRRCRPRRPWFRCASTVVPLAISWLPRAIVRRFGPSACSHAARAPRRHLLRPRHLHRHRRHRRHHRETSGIRTHAAAALPTCATALLTLR
jgi:hypothetical protein